MSELNEGEFELYVIRRIGPGLSMRYWSSLLGEWTDLPNATRWKLRKECLAVIKWIEKLECDERVSIMQGTVIRRPDGTER